jgi:hypothetical protein
MLSVSEVNQVEEAIETRLHVRVHPIAFKLIQDDALPEGTIVPSCDIGKKPQPLSSIRILCNGQRPFIL